MNWFTSAVNVNVDSLDGVCEHLEESGANVAPHATYENDPWGREGYGMCQACYEKSLEAADAELEVCYDCGQEFPMGEMVEWRWYDFYAPQGDEPLFICKHCQCQDKHRQRVARDQELYRQEFADDEVEDRVWFTDGDLEEADYEEEDCVFCDCCGMLEYASDVDVVCFGIGTSVLGRNLAEMCSNCRQTFFSDVQYYNIIK